MARRNNLTPEDLTTLSSVIDDAIAANLEGGNDDEKRTRLAKLFRVSDKLTLLQSKGNGPATPRAPRARKAKVSQANEDEATS